MMNQLLKTFFGLLIFQQSPQALPDSPKLLRALLALDILFSLGYLQQALGWQEAILHIGLSLSVIAGLTYGILTIRHLSHRFKQTFIALLGMDLLLTVLHWLLEMAGILSPLSSEGDTVTAIVEMGLLIWTVLIQGNIFRHAISLSLFKGCLVAFAIMMITFLAAFSLTSLQNTKGERRENSPSHEQKEFELEDEDPIPKAVRLATRRRAASNRSVHFST